MVIILQISLLTFIFHNVGNLQQKQSNYFIQDVKMNIFIKLVVIDGN